MAPKRKKPPTIEQEAKDFVKSNKNTAVKVLDEGLSPSRVQLAASALAGLLASGSRARAEELVDEAYRYADLLLNHKD
jgi:hypothetical protein